MKTGQSNIGKLGMIHLNGDLLCAIDTETTGLHPGKNDIIEIAIVPLGEDLKVLQQVPIFHLFMQPGHPENISPEAMKVNKIDLAKLAIEGVDPFTGADLLDRWFANIGLVPGKKICPLGQNWPFDGAFIKSWIGPENFEAIFSHRFRELTSAILFCNDRDYFAHRRIRFPQVNLGAVAKELDVKHARAHTALDDALVLAECYRRMMRFPIEKGIDLPPSELFND